MLFPEPVIPITAMSMSPGFFGAMTSAVELPALVTIVDQCALKIFVDGWQVENSVDAGATSKCNIWG